MLPVMFKRSWLPSVFDDLFGDDIVSARKPAVPAVNVMETDSEYVMEIAVPGLKKESCGITIEDGILSVSVKNEKNSEEEKNGKWIRREFSYSEYERKYPVPENVDEKGISAKAEHGVLTVTLPKIKEKKNGKSVNIDIK